MASLAVAKTPANVFDFRSLVNSGSLFQGLNSELPKNPRKVNNPLEPPHTPAEKQCLCVNAVIYCA